MAKQESRKFERYDFPNTTSQVDTTIGTATRGLVEGTRNKGGKALKYAFAAALGALVGTGGTLAYDSITRASAQGDSKNYIKPSLDQETSEKPVHLTVREFFITLSDKVNNAGLSEQFINVFNLYLEQSGALYKYPPEDGDSREYLAKFEAEINALVIAQQMNAEDQQIVISLITEEIPPSEAINNIRSSKAINNRTLPPYIPTDSREQVDNKTITPGGIPHPFNYSREEESDLSKEDLKKLQQKYLTQLNQKIDEELTPEGKEVAKVYFSLSPLPSDDVEMDSALQEINWLKKICEIKDPKLRSATLAYVSKSMPPLQAIFEFKALEKINKLNSADREMAESYILEGNFPSVALTRLIHEREEILVLKGLKTQSSL